MLITLFILVLIGLCFAGVLLVGAPYLPTLKPQIDAGLELLDLKPGQSLLELGCGDGKVMIAAAEQGLTVIGYELNPLLVIVCWLRTRKYRGRVKVVWGNYWEIDWPKTEGIYAFILQKYMSKLDKKVIQENRNPVKVVSFAFTIPDRKSTAEKAGLYLYEYK